MSGALKILGPFIGREIEMHNYNCFNIWKIYINQIRNNSNDNKISLTIAVKYLVIQNA